MHEPPVVFAGDAGQGVGQEFLGGGQLFVTGRQHLVGDQHGPQVSRGARACVGVQRVMGASRCPGGHLGQQSSAGAVAEPVQRGPWGVGGGDRFVDRCQLGRDLFGAGAEQVPGAAAQRAGCASALLVEFVLDPATGAGVSGGGCAGAVGAGGGGRAGWGDEPPDRHRRRRRCRGGGARRCSRGRRPVPRATGRPVAGPRRSARRPPWIVGRSRCRPVRVRSRTNTAFVAGSGCRQRRASGSSRRRCRGFRRGRGGRSAGSVRTARRAVVVGRRTARRTGGPVRRGRRPV